MYFLALEHIDSETQAALVALVVLFGLLVVSFAFVAFMFWQEHQRSQAQQTRNVQLDAAQRVLLDSQVADYTYRNWDRLRTLLNNPNAGLTPEEQALFGWVRDRQYILHAMASHVPPGLMPQQAQNPAPHHHW